MSGTSTPWAKAERERKEMEKEKEKEKEERACMEKESRRVAAKEEVAAVAVWRAPRDRMLSEDTICADRDG